MLRDSIEPPRTYSHENRKLATMHDDPKIGMHQCTDHRQRAASLRLGAGKSFKRSEKSNLPLRIEKILSESASRKHKTHAGPKKREKYIRRSLRAAGGEAAKLRYSTACTGQKTLPTSWRTTSSTCARSFSNSMRDSARAASPERYFSARSNHTGSGVEIEGYLSI